MKKTRKTMNALALALSASLMFTGCGSSEDKTFEEAASQILEDFSNDDIEATEEKEASAKDNEKYFADLSDYGYFDESELEGITYTDPFTGEESKYLFKREAIFPMSSEEYGNVESFKEEVRDLLNGMLSDEMVDNCDVVMAIYVYNSPLDEDVTLSERKVIYEFEVAGVRKTISVIENQFKKINDGIYIINRNILVDGEETNIGLFMQGDVVDTGVFDKPLLETFAVPRGLYTTDDLQAVLDNASKSDGKLLGYENEE